MEVLHVSPRMPVPVYMSARFRELPECQCKGRHYVWSRTTHDLTADDIRRQLQIQKCQYYETPAEELNDSDDNNNTRLLSKVLWVAFIGDDIQSYFPVIYRKFYSTRNITNS